MPLSKRSYSRRKQPKGKQQKASGPALENTPLTVNVDYSTGLNELVEQGFQPNNVNKQYDIILLALRQLLDGREPRPQQVRALRRLVYQLGDALLIARTGFGKSIVFQAFTVLT